MKVQAGKIILVKNTVFLISLCACLGCQIGVVKRAAETVERDASLVCPSQTPDRCAISSEFQDLADLTFSEKADPGLHYVSILDVGEDALLSRIHLIRAARESIDIQTFIWDDDEVGQVVFRELLQAARRGVKVRIILDQFGTYVSVGVIAQMAIAHENIDIMFFRPVKNSIDMSASHPMNFFISDPATLNKRMHNKIFVIDGRIGIVGGRNVQNAYYDYDTKICFKDMDILVIGPVVGDMVKSFNQYWDHKLTKPALEMPDVANQAVRLYAKGYQMVFDNPAIKKLDDVCRKADSHSIVSTQPAMNLYAVNQVSYVSDRPEKKKCSKADHWDSTRHIEELVTSAQDEVVMQTPYLVQDRKGFRDFKTLRKKQPGMKIALSTNSLASADHFYVYAMCLKQRQFYLEGIDAHMYEFKPVPGDVHTMVPRYQQLVREANDVNSQEVPEPDAKGPRLIVHAKFFVVDSHISFVGSHNFDPRAKNLNTECAVIVWDAAFADAIKQIFDRDTAPQNSWVAAPCQKIPVVGDVSDLIAAISSSLPLFDVWPLEYSSNYELKEGFEPVPRDHPDFYEHYDDVGIFPQMGLSYQHIGTRIVKAFGGLFRDIM